MHAKVVSANSPFVNIDPTPLRSSSYLLGASSSVKYGVYVPRTSEHGHGYGWTTTQGIMEESCKVYLESWGIVSVWKCDV
jgi:hypothetical protein